MDINTITNLIITLGIGAITFFLKRAFTRLDSCASKDEVKEVHDKLDNTVGESEFRECQCRTKELSGRLDKKIDNCASKEDIKECRSEIKSLSDRFASKGEVNEIKNRMDKLEKGIDYLKENSVRKEDFVRLMTRIEGKIDNLMNNERRQI